MLLFLKEKQTGKIKGRACLNGAPQWAYIPKEDAASPTVSAKSTFITGAIAASERRKVRCYNIPSAFVNTDVDKDVLMVLKGELAEMMIQIAPQVYRKYVTVDKKGMKLLYVKLQKALYRLMRASLLFYRKLQKEFEAYGLQVNPYKPCVANMETKSRKQLTVIWHVDNLMASCEDNFELTNFLCYLGKIYGTKLSMHTGQKHEYLGMDMEFNKDGMLEASMITYLKNVIEQFPEETSGRVLSPAAEHFFVVRDKIEERVLEEERALAFHRMVAQLLFMCTRAQQDIQMAVAFLTTKVKSPDKDNWGKLKRVLKYLNGTKYLKLRLSMENMGMLKWYVDGLHNVHPDCRGHGGALLSMGKGATTSYSRKLKLNTQSSTESKLVTMDMYMPEMLWSLYFIQAKGYEAECIGFYQDNISTQLLIKNERISSGNRTKHIKAKFFFITDRVDKGKIKVMDCLTKEMWADVLTKPLQGMAFRTMRAELMNCPVNYQDPAEDTEEQERKATKHGLKGRSRSTSHKLVTWKREVASLFKTPQECVEHSGIFKAGNGMTSRHLMRDSYP